MSYFEAKPFPFRDWDKKTMTMVDRVPVHLPIDWVDQIKMPPPPGPACIEVECQAVFAATTERPRKLQEIEGQARDYDTLVNAVLGVVATGALPKTREMIRAAFWDLTPGVFRTKMTVNRGRPAFCCDLDIDPMFPPGDPDHPGHPSYPSGHSSQAFTMALLLAEIRPASEKDLMAAAYSVGRNREVAGLHYASDTAGGRKLAEGFVGLLMKTDSFKAVFDAAKAELEGALAAEAEAVIAKAKGEPDAVAAPK